MQTERKNLKKKNNCNDENENKNTNNRKNEKEHKKVTIWERMWHDCKEVVYQDDILEYIRVRSDVTGVCLSVCYHTCLNVCLIVHTIYVSCITGRSRAHILPTNSITGILFLGKRRDFYWKTAWILVGWSSHLKKKCALWKACMRQWLRLNLNTQAYLTKRLSIEVWDETKLTNKIA